MDESINITADLVQLARLALSEKPGDVRLFTARLVRKYRKLYPEVASALESHLRARPERSLSPLRDAAAAAAPPHIWTPAQSEESAPRDNESRLSLLRQGSTRGDQIPILPAEIQSVLTQLIAERKQADRLAERGLSPAKSAIFVGQPGVGKTMTARWVAAQLELPLLVLDLAAVISSYLGKSGSNVRSAFDHARRRPCVLLLDEIDAVAKRRSDEADVGELKRLVTVIMQEVDEWPSTSLLLAATNHPELIDRALWRRFDLVVEFTLPGPQEIREAVRRYSGEDTPALQSLAPALAAVFEGLSLSDVERNMQRIRRALALSQTGPAEILEEVLRGRSLPRGNRRIQLALALSRSGHLSDHRIRDLTGVSRDTIRKYRKNETPEVEGLR